MSDIVDDQWLDRETSRTIRRDLDEHESTPLSVRCKPGYEGGDFADDARYLLDEVERLRAANDHARGWVQKMLDDEGLWDEERPQRLTVVRMMLRGALDGEGR